MLSKPGNKARGSSLTPISLIFLIYCFHFAINFMQGSTLFSHSSPLIVSLCFSVTLVRRVCTNPLLWSLGALNWKHIVSGATDEARCFMSASPQLGYVRQPLSQCCQRQTASISASTTQCISMRTGIFIFSDISRNHFCIVISVVTVYPSAFSS